MTTTHSKICITCSVPLTGKRRKFCSTKCKHKHTNAKFQNYQAQQLRGKLRKEHLINLRGGKCEICGYSKNYASLCFHHLDPTIKEFHLDARMLSNNKWSKILAEFEKCQLLCMNCHGELHNPTLALE